jgi:hypothetical protein
MTTCIGELGVVAVSEAQKGHEIPVEDPETGKGRGAKLSRFAKCAVAIGIGAAIAALIVGYKVSHPLADTKFGRM